MAALLHELSGQYDIVLIDSPPLLTVSDSIPLVSLVSGVLLVARMKQTTRDGMVRLQQVVAQAGGSALGAVATAVSSGGLYGGYGYQSGQSGYGPQDGVAAAANGHASWLARAGRRPGDGSPSASEPTAGDPLVAE